MKKEAIVVEIGITMYRLLEKLVATGLYGLTVAEVMERLTARELAAMIADGRLERKA